MRNAIAFYACAASAWLPPTPLHCTRARARPALRASDEAEDESIGRRRFVEVLDIEPQQPSATEANRRWTLPSPTWLVSLALLGPLEWLIIAPVLGFLPAKDMSPDVIRAFSRPWPCFSSCATRTRRPCAAAVALPLSPLRLTIDDEQLPVRVARRYDEDSVTAFAAGCARSDVRRDVESLCARHRAAVCARRVRKAGVGRSFDAGRIIWRSRAGIVAARRRGPPGRPFVRAPSSRRYWPRGAATPSSRRSSRRGGPRRRPRRKSRRRARGRRNISRSRRRPSERGHAPRRFAPRRTDGGTTAAPTSGGTAPRRRGRPAAVAGTWLAPCLAQLLAFGLVVVRDREEGRLGTRNDVMNMCIGWGAPTRVIVR